MNWTRLLRRRAYLLVALGCVAGSGLRADTIFMKSGVVYRSLGMPDKDGTLVFMYDGLKRTVVRDSRISRIVPDNSYRTGEKFQLDQPLIVHGGLMPKEVISVQAGPWNELGRRSFRYVGSNLKPISMEQAIIDIGPHVVKFRGVDGFWVSQVATAQVPRSVVTGLLARVQQKNLGERERVVRYLMDAGWYTEAKKELDRMIHDFPDSDLGERAASARTYMVQAEATQRRAEVEVRRRAQQFHKVAALLKLFHEKEIGSELLVEVRELMRHADEQNAEDIALATDLRKLEGKLSAADRAAWKPRTAEALKALQQAPDAVRERFLAWRQARARGGTSDEVQFALAMSGFVVGREAAVEDLKTADMLWQARDLVREYLSEQEASGRESVLAKLDALGWPADPAGASEGFSRLDLVNRLIPLMAPALYDPAGQSEETVMRKVSIEGNEEPTEYAVRLPPEYHPLRSYPALVALHWGKGPKAVVEVFAAEAARRGYIVIAPEYSVSGDSSEYHYSPSEHAAVELALRDARKRYSIDSDRVYVAGQLGGANMAWDLALGHPDVFAGVVVISGFPAYYVPRSMIHHERLPLMLVIGDLAPASNEIVFGSYLKPMILKGWDVTYIEYQRRGVEEFPEEIVPAFEWMDKRRRDPVPRTFETVSARLCDDRFYGAVIREFAPGRATAPEAVEKLGQNLSPARLKLRTSSLSNLYNLKVEGVRKLDVWLSPRLIDFKRKLELRINDRPHFKGQARLTLEHLLEDVRLRGDRQQMYWLKFAAG